MRLRKLLALNRLSLTLASMVVVVALFVARVPFLELIELRTYDLRLRSRGSRQPSPAVVLATIDEKSLDVEGRWPWPRAKIARLIDLLSADGARVIALDIGFPEPDENSTVALLDRVRQTVEARGIHDAGLRDFLDENRRHADNDAVLAQAIQESSAAVVLGYFLHMSAAELDAPIDRQAIDQRLTVLDGSKYPLVRSRGGDPDDLPVLQAYAPEPALPLLARAAAASGYLNIRQDPDGTLRWMPLAIRSGAVLLPPLSIQAVWQYLGRPPLVVTATPYGIDGIQIGNVLVPTNESGGLLVNYVGPPRTFPHVSITDVLRGAMPAGTFRDRIVLVGATATGLYDVRSTPFSTAFAGLEVHATVIDNVLTRAFLSKPGWSKAYDVLAIVVLAALVGIVLPRLGAVMGLVFVGSMLVVHILVAREMFTRYGIWLDLVHPVLALAITYTTLTTYDYVGEQRERRRVRDTFGRYVAPVVVEQVLADPSRLALGGQEKVLTVLFSDLQGFTSYSERYTPQQMIDLLSQYYARMTERIFERGGMLKEYVGDELMAIFGAPLEQADHAHRACAAALEMRAHRHAMSEEWTSTGRPPLNARTGVNSGNMLVGNLGSEYRFSYGVLGDNVNLGSRLEGLNKEYGTEIIIGENTAELVGDAFLLRELDQVRVVGKKKPTRIYELLGMPGTALPDRQTEALRSFAAALTAYREMRWRDALRLFEETLAHWPGDGPSQTMIRRCRIYTTEPPPGDWDGVFEATRK